MPVLPVGQSESYYDQYAIIKLKDAASTIVRLSGNISNYNITDIGRQIDRMQFVNENIVYYHEKGYDPAFKTITWSGVEEMSVLNQLKTWFESNDPITNAIAFTDKWGHAWNNVVIKKFDFSHVKILGGYSYSIELLVILSTAYVFKVGGSKVYGIESCSISKKTGEAEIVKLINGAMGIVVKSYTVPIYDIRMSGIELIDTDGTGKFTKTLANIVSDLTVPDSRTFKVMLSDLSNELIVGVSGFQKFSIAFVAAESEDAFIEQPDDAIIDAYSIVDNSGKQSVHQTIRNLVIQIFDSIIQYDLSFSCYIDKDKAVSTYPYGTQVTITLDRDYQDSVILNRSLSPIDGSNKLMKLNVTALCYKEGV